MINAKELLTGDVTKLSYVTRFSGIRTHCQETVATHSYYVILYCHLIGSALEEAGLYVDVGRLLSYATYHDLDEAVTGDFPRPFKYSDPRLKTLIEEVSKKLVVRLVDSIDGSFTGSMKSFRKAYDSWKNAKNQEEVEGVIVCIADCLSAVSFMIQEVQAGNWQMAEQLDCVSIYARGIKGLVVSKSELNENPSQVFFNVRQAEILITLLNDTTDLIELARRKENELRPR